MTHRKMKEILKKRIMLSYKRSYNNKELKQSLRDEVIKELMITRDNKE